ncbi:hypothetical protein BG011_003417 [Mortierella polycephala]|uniref:Ion transport domain-containing protein n=1 Tax=Mortierella polycephala TaxID=41804 RepID=A0A9P6Q314_9FUNG|nr:hypothetical protein BG011_003417 [Mortierella polycephala]
MLSSPVLTFGLSSFTTASLYLLRSCPYKSCTLNSKFPSHYYVAITTTLFYASGRYDSVADELDSEDWSLQLLMIAYFFFTVVLMLNVLIALVNQAFDDGNETWRLAWLQNQLYLIENVENLTFHIPGFREHFDYFPDEIYYSATAKEVEDYRARYRADDLSSGPKMDPSADPVELSSADHVVTAATAAVNIERPMQELKGELRENLDKLQGQLQDQRASSGKQIAALQEQMKEMHAMLSVFLKNKNETDAP